MEKSQMKLIGIVCLVISVVCVFIAVERYQSNAKQVRGMNQMMNQSSSQFGGLMNQMPGGRVKLKAGTPGATKYALFFAVVSGIAGGVLLVISQTGKPEEDQLT
jgi:hypothetical protein